MVLNILVRPSDTAKPRSTSLYSCPFLQSHFPKLRKLVITRGQEFVDDDGSTDIGLGSEASLRVFHELRSLNIGSFLLLGDGRKFDMHKRIYKHLPSSLIELEVMFDGQIKNTFITGWYARNPRWLFYLLERKERYNRRLARIRIISLLEWEPTYDDKRLWGMRYIPPPGDWSPQEGNENWRPPMELVTAFQKASVSFGVWLHKLRNYKMIVPDGAWFADT